MPRGVQDPRSQWDGHSGIGVPPAPPAASHPFWAKKYEKSEGCVFFGKKDEPTQGERLDRPPRVNPSTSMGRRVLGWLAGAKIGGGGKHPSRGSTPPGSRGTGMPRGSLLPCEAQVTGIFLFIVFLAYLSIYFVFFFPLWGHGRAEALSRFSEFVPRVALAAGTRPSDSRGTVTQEPP